MLHFLCNSITALPTFRFGNMSAYTHQEIHVDFCSLLIFGHTIGFSSSRWCSVCGAQTTYCTMIAQSYYSRSHIGGKLVDFCLSVSV